MDPIQLLKQQHVEVKRLLAQVEQLGSQQADECTRMAHDAVNKLSVHEEIEEELLYPAIKQAVKEQDDRDVVLEAFEEHHVSKLLIAEIRQGKAQDESFLAKCTVLCELISHHIREEEGEMFPLAEACLGREQLDQLGDQIQRRFAQIEHQPPRITVSLIEEPAVKLTQK